MGMKIFKYALEIDDVQIVRLPIGFTILSVAEQNDKIVMYALVNPSMKTTKPILIKIFGTGHPVQESEECSFLGTVKLLGGTLMFHVFIDRHRDCI